jgi:hypothetical protein
MSTRSAATIALLAALVAALGFLLSGVPNVELVSLATFVSGWATGARGGALAGGIGMAIYSGMNPYGAAPPPTFVAQVAGCAIVGVAGGLAAGRLALPGRRAWARALLFGGAGSVLTLAYDGLTNLGTAVSIGAIRDPWPVLVAGWAFGAWHVASNAALFAGLGPPLVAALARRRSAAP